MKNKRNALNQAIWILLCSLSFSALSAQNIEKMAVKNHILKLFDGMRSADTTLIRSLIHPNATLLSSSEDKEGQPSILQGGGVNAWLKGVASAPKGSLDEQLDYIDIRIDSDRMATAWTPYRFYRAGTFSHCGVNSFQLAKDGDTWFITSIIDTRNRNGCDSSTLSWKEKTIQTLDKKLDLWHSDAATGNFDSYFNAMTEKSIFIGTDETEVWDKKTFMEFTEPHFADGEGWVFTSKRRSWHFSSNYHTAWFDEELDTWMGVCRGSGVYVWENNEWMLAHYVLSMTIPNTKVNDVLDLLKNN